MKTNYKGKGEHSVIQLEKIIKERETEISELKKQKYEMMEMLNKSFDMCDKLQFPTEQELNTIKLEIKKLKKEVTEPT